MAYVVQSTERVRASGADFETKAMLYLMNCCDDSHEIYCFVIDFFNDVTGLNNFADKAWDLQSKAASGNSPKGIGKELVTLFKNYMSDLKFDYLILFLGGVTSSFRIDDNLNVFDIGNVKDIAKKKLKEGLFEEGLDKTYIDDAWLTDENYEGFINKVTFVINDKTKADYIRNLVNISPNYIPKDEVLESIFNTIRDAQSNKKNNESVEGEVINQLSEAFCYDRHIKTKEIRLMVLSTFINGNLMDRGVPVYFSPVIRRYDVSRQKDIIEDCQLQLSTLLFDKENSDSFWKLFELISDAVVNNKDLDTIETYNIIAGNPIIHNPKLDVLSTQYLISVMKEAIA